MSNDNLNSFTCPHCRKQVVEPYINCPECFNALKEIKLIESGAYRNLMVGPSLITGATLTGFTLGEHGGLAATSIIFGILGGMIIIRSLIKYLNARNRRDFMHVK